MPTRRPSGGRLSTPTPAVATSMAATITTVGHSPRNSTLNSATCSTSVFDSVTATAKLRSCMARSSAAVAPS